MIRFLASAGALALLSVPLAAQPHGHDNHANGPQADPNSDPHAGHAMPAGDPHAGHHPPPADGTHDQGGHAGHDGHSAHPDARLSPGPAPPPPAARSGPDHAADAVWGADIMQASRRALSDEHGGMPAWALLIERMEWQSAGRDGLAVETEAWVGGDIDRLLLKVSLHGTRGSLVEEAEVQALWSHAVSPFFDMVAGLRRDMGDGPDRTYAAAGIQGLAPYWIEVEAMTFLSDRGDVTGRLTLDHDAALTNAWTLQPSLEADFAFQDVPESRIGAGLSTVEAGLRLRYRLSARVEPYVGVSVERSFGRTRNYREDDGARGSVSALAGLRLNF